jgi:hypothetical protein
MYRKKKENICQHKIKGVSSKGFVAVLCMSAHNSKIWNKLNHLLWLYSPSTQLSSIRSWPELVGSSSRVTRNCQSCRAPLLAAPGYNQTLRVKVITCQFWMMSLNVVFSFCNLFWVLVERNRGKQEFHCLHTLLKIKLTLKGLLNILLYAWLLWFYSVGKPNQNVSKCFSRQMYGVWLQHASKIK